MLLRFCVAVFCACWGVGTGFATVQTLPPVCVVDDVQQTVCVQSAKRVLSLAPHLSEIVAFLGGTAQLVAVDQSSDYPDAVRKLPRVGDSLRLDLERVLAYRPDLVLVWASGTSPAAIAKLRQAGIPVYVSEPQTLQAVADSLQRVGALLGRTQTAREQALAWKAQLDQLKVVQTSVTRPVRVFYQVWPSPLMTLSDQHVVSELIRHCGGVTAFSDVKALAPTVSIESVLKFNPQIVYVGSDAGSSQHWLRWTQLDAVANRRIFKVHSEVMVRNGPRLLQAAQRVCEDIRTVRELQP